jgi:hypothetical protein
MTVRRIEVERVTVVSSNTFDVVVASVDAAIGHPDMVAVGTASQAATSMPRLRK